jgi:hypothetical protein
MPIQYGLASIVQVTELNTVLPLIEIYEPDQATVITRDVWFRWRVTNKEAGTWTTKWQLTNTITNTIIVSYQNDWQTAAEYHHVNIPNASYRFSVQVKDKFGNTATENKEFIVRREIAAPEQIAPIEGAILPSGNVVFQATIPRGEDGDLFDFDIQILEVLSLSPLQTRYVDTTPWFSSATNYNGWAVNGTPMGGPVPEDTGGFFTFAKALDPRKRYRWKCRVRTQRGGGVVYSLESPLKQFTVGVLGTKLLATAVPSMLRGDDTSASTVTASVVDANNSVDRDWTGAVTFALTNLVGARFKTGTGVVQLSNGVATTQVVSSALGQLTIVMTSTGLTQASATVQFVVNRLPGAPEWAPSIGETNPTEISVDSAELIMTVPVDLDGDRLHFMVEIDTTPDFDSPDLIVAESRFDRSFWQYYDGNNWVEFPENGVEQGRAGTQVKYLTGSVLQDGKRYYCRAAAWDQWQS